MIEIIGEQIKAGRAEGLKKRLVPLLTLILVIAVTVGLFIFSLLNPEKLNQLGNYSYLGIFLICLISNASVLLPVPGIFIALPLVATLNPVLVGLVGATGGTIGEITGYITGYSGWSVIKRNHLHGRVEGWMKRWGAWVIFVFAVVPYLPVDITGIVAGTLRYPVWKFWLVCWVGKSIKYIILALSFSMGFEIFRGFIGKLIGG